MTRSMARIIRSEVVTLYPSYTPLIVRLHPDSGSVGWAVAVWAHSLGIHWLIETVDDWAAILGVD